MRSCQHFNDPAACLAHRQLIVDYRNKFHIPLPHKDSMCANCRRTRPERDHVESENLLERLRSAGL